MTIYVVVGASGEYENYTEWMVAGFKSNQSAKELAANAQARAAAILAAGYHVDWEKENEYDSHMFIMGLRPVEYRVDPLELLDVEE